MADRAPAPAVEHTPSSPPAGDGGWPYAVSGQNLVESGVKGRWQKEVPWNLWERADQLWGAGRATCVRGRVAWKVALRS